MSDYQPKYLPGDTVPLLASATIVGGQLVTYAGAVAGDASIVCAGVAAYDAVSGQTLTVIRIGIQRLVASATILVGDPICAAAAGQIRKWVVGTDPTHSYIGKALTAATATNSADVALFGV